MPYNLIPSTIKLDREFSFKLRMNFVHDYLLNKKRLRYILDKQIAVMNEDELKFKYQTIFPTKIKTIDDILKLAKLSRDEIDFSKMPKTTSFNIDYPVRKPKTSPDAYRILFIDASQIFSKDTTVELDIVEPPLGCMMILTYLNEIFGDKIYGEIIKTGVDVDSFDELKAYVKKFSPDLIAMRTMSYFKNFFAEVVREIRTVNPRRGLEIPVIAGGPHPTIAPKETLLETGIDACIIGEGEIICAELIKTILNNDKKFPSKSQLREIKGLAFMDD